MGGIDRQPCSGIVTVSVAQMIVLKTLCFIFVIEYMLFIHYKLSYLCILCVYISLYICFPFLKM